MASPITYPVDDRELDDAALWAVIDSAAAAASKSKYSTTVSPLPLSIKHPPLSVSSKNNNSMIDAGEVVQNHHRPTRSSSSDSPPKALPSYKTPPNNSHTYTYMSPPSPNIAGSDYASPIAYERETTTSMSHSLSGRFPSVSLFKEYQSAALAILEKTDYTLISGNPYIKKIGWRKISCYFNISYEIKDKTIEFDENRNVQRAEFVVRAHMHGGRFSDGWGSCDRREKRFMKPNNDIPSTAETRAKNKACQDLLGIGDYRPAACRT